MFGYQIVAAISIYSMTTAVMDHSPTLTLDPQTRKLLSVGTNSVIEQQHGPPHSIIVNFSCRCMSSMWAAMHLLHPVTLCHVWPAYASEG